MSCKVELISYQKKKNVIFLDIRRNKKISHINVKELFTFSYLLNNKFTEQFILLISMSDFWYPTLDVVCRSYDLNYFNLLVNIWSET